MIPSLCIFLAVPLASAMQLTSAFGSSSSQFIVRSRVPLAEILSPFEDQTAAPKQNQGPLPLTLENVEMVLDGMRPYLLADGGNVAVRDIDGATVVLELQGACGSCPSSEMTMKMGLEKGLLEKIPRNEHQQLTSIGSIGHSMDVQCQPCLFWFRGSAL